ncbi:MAG: MFS transporter [Rhodobacteraceae bacterium]|nr:MFS transporter [Paracoccaceae bacterium]
MKDSRYVVVFGACLTQFTIIGLLFSYGLFFNVFEAEFGWSRTLLSSCSSLAFLMMGILAMAGGRLSDRFGPRRVLAFTGLAFGLGYALISQISQSWQLFVIFGVFIGLGLSTHDVVTLSTIGRWYERRRGMMTGVVKVGTSVGQMTVPPVTALLILTFGWRVAVIVLGLSAVVLLLIAALSMKNPPRPAALEVDVSEPGLTFAQARGTRVFWTMCIIQLLFFPSVSTIPLHLAVHGIDLGMNAAKAATLLSVIGGASIVGRLTIGALVDKIGAGNSYTICFVFLALSLAAMMNITAHLPLFVVVAFYGFGHGGFFTLVAPAVAEYFGMRAHGAIFGTVLFFGTIGGAIAPVLAGLSFDSTGSYFYAFLGLLILAIIGFALTLSLPRRA